MSSPDYSSDDDSDQHYENQEPFHHVCRYQTARFHDRECSRFYDCPTHSIDRAPSDGEHDEQEEEDDDNDNDIDDGDEDDEEEDEMDEDEDDLHSEQDGYLHAEEDPEPMATPLRSGNGADPNVIDLTGSSPEQERQQRPAHTAGQQSNSPEVIDLTEDSPSPDAVAKARAGKARQQDIIRQRPTQSSAEAGPSATIYQTTTANVSGGSSPSGQRRPATPPSPPPPIRRRTSTNDFGPAPRTAQQQAPVSLVQLQQQQQQQQQPRPSVSSRRPSEIVLPRWQPDAEVTICPICGTQFSVFIRKHHCRYGSPL